MRSLLFVPGDSEKKLAKALDAGADALLIDLEDSVADGAKADARRLARAALAAPSRPRTGPQLWVRINALTSPFWQSDLEAVMAAAPDGIMLPKAAGGDDVHHLSVALELAEKAAGIAAGTTRIIAIATEVPSALFALGSYAGCSNRLAGLAWGTEDLSAALAARSARDAQGRLGSPFRLARDLTLFAAAGAGVAAIDEIHADYRDLDGLAAVAAEAARDGFSAKMAIHPQQVAIINSAFSPTEQQIAEAEAIVALFAASPEAGVVSLDGRMLDRPHLRRAERILERAKARN